ncbi:hypothetical protein [Terrimonas ferruginea]|uniref:hypothetical protein n=1 Tax=Terrimonas ferruginea TaxID=249 RepID=UPI0004243F36|nr:hypothetical protein [Terrimonas ferruginea]
MRLFLLLLLLNTGVCLAQRDSLWTADSTYWHIKRPTHSKFWGNSFYIGEEVNFARKTEYGLSFGRARGVSWDHGRGLVMVRVKSWGLGYSATPVRGKVHQSIKLFGEYAQFPPLFFMPFSARTDYLYQLTNGQHYLRPSFGFSLLTIDLHFHYSFLLNGNWRENLYRQGFTIRVKQFPGRWNKWERRTHFIKGRSYLNR